MQGVMVSAATGALNSVLEKLGTLLVQEYKLHKGVHGEIKFLTAELTAMQAFLLKMSEEEDPDQQDRVWMSTVRELSYDIEDSLDDFMQDQDDKDRKPDGFINKIKHILGKLGKRKAHHQMFQDLKKQVIEAGERNERYKTRHAFSNAKNATVDPKALVIFEHASKLVGIDRPKAEIIKLLTRGVSTDKQPKLVSIVGTGGMGKTTLANQVYQELKGDYECWAFVSVSRNPDITNILRTIFSVVAKIDYGSTEVGSIQQLISKITDFLANKRYFVVVDDIWNMDTWEIIKCAFPTTSSSSIVITTTRMNNVAHSCCSLFNGHIYNIRPLDLVHSRQLFHTRLFKSDEDCPSYLQEISEQILEKCGGLPLAIIAISGLLANSERTETLWGQVKDSIGRALERNSSVEGMMKILSLSYFDLPPYLKTCLLYLSMYLEDSTIEKECLIRRWTTEGFIHREGMYTAYELGERYFNELLNRGLIQPGKTSEYGEVKSCRVHDTILDFIISKSIEESFVTLLGVPILTTGDQSKVVRRLCLQGVKEGNSKVLTEGLVLSHVRSIIVVGGLVVIPSLEEFRHLRVLDLTDCSELKDHNLENIVRLYQLRYLNLKGTKISKLPEQIGRLCCLELLDLRKTGVEELPASIVNLGKLSHILVDDYVQFPDGIAKMQALEALEDVMVSIQPFDFLCGFGQLKNLRNLQLDVEDTDVIGEERDKAIASSLCKLGIQNLHSLIIYNWSRLLQEPLCLPTLEKLITWLSAVPQVPTWVSSLRNLQQLRIEVEGVKQDDLCMLGALPSLVVLHLLEEKTDSNEEEKTDSNEKLRVSGEIGFQSSRIFIYYACYQPVNLMFGAGSMPKLEKLVLDRWRDVQGDYLDFGIDVQGDCLDFGIENLMFGAGSMPKLEKLVLDRWSVVGADCLDFGIENLPCLNTVEFINVRGDDGIVEAVKTAMERAANAHPNHPSLFFKW